MSELSIDQSNALNGDAVLANELSAGTGGGEMNAQLNGNVPGGSANMSGQVMDGGKKHRKSKSSKKSKKSKKSKASKKSRRNKSRRK
jgi:hypothetical protein